MDKEELSSVINYFYNNIDLFELHCNPYFIILRFQTKKATSTNNHVYCQNIVKYIHKMKGTIYYSNNIVEIRLPYKKDPLQRPKKRL